MIPSRPAVGGRGVSRANGSRLTARSARRSVQAPASASVGSRPSSTKPLTPHLKHQHQDFEHAPYAYGIQSDVVAREAAPLEDALHYSHHAPSVLALPFVPPSDGSLGAAALAVVAMQQQQLHKLQRQQHQLELQLAKQQAVAAITSGTSDAAVQSSPQHARGSAAGGLHSHSSSVDSFETLMLSSTAAAPGTTMINIGSIPIVVPLAASLVSMGSSSSAFSEPEPIAVAMADAQQQQQQQHHTANSHQLAELQEDDEEEEQQQQPVPVQAQYLEEQQQAQQQQAQYVQQEQVPAAAVFKSKLRATSAEFVPGRAYSASLDSTPSSATTPPSADSSASPAATQALTVDTSAASVAEAMPAYAHQHTTPPTTPVSPARSLSSKDNTVTVSARSSVKDAAGAVAKVLERRGVCMLVALRRRAEGIAETTHVAAKTLAVSRFYINTHMGGRGSSSGSGSGMAEVTFVPFCRQLGGGRGVDPDAFSFMVFKTQPSDLEAVLPAASGQSAQLALPMIAAANAAAAVAQQQGVDGSAPQQQGQQQQVLKAAAGTDGNKLSNAIIHHVLEHGHTVLQLAGSGACHNVMRALVKARARLASKFGVGAAVAASFATEDTSGALGRATVFLRLDVVRCALQGMAGQHADRLIAQEQAGAFAQAVAA